MNNKARSKPAGTAPPRKPRGATQPPPTGAQAASPAAPVMKQFSKTRREGGERS